MGDQDIGRNGMLEAMAGKKLTQRQSLDRISRSPASVNIGAMAWGALAEAGLVPKERADNYIWRPIHGERSTPERGSWQYDSYTLAMLLLMLGPLSTDMLKAELAWTALTVRNWKRLIVISPRGSFSQPRNYGFNYRGPVVATAGHRQLWSLGPFRREPRAGQLPERGMAAFVLAFIRGESMPGSVWDHHSMGFVLKAVNLRRWERLPSEFLAALRDRTLSHRTVTALVEALNKVENRTTFRVVRLKNGSQVVTNSISLIHTRGPVAATVFDADTDELTWLSSTEPAGGGEWTQAMGEVTRRGLVRSWGSGGSEVTLQVPRGETDFIVQWDHAGARALLPTVDPGTLPDPPTDEVDPPGPAPGPNLSAEELVRVVNTNIRSGRRMDAGLIIFDQLAKDSGDAWVDQGLRTWGEVGKLILLKLKATAIVGSKTLTDVLKR